MNQSELISIYTPVFNTKPFLQQFLESVLGQTYQNFELVLLDNGCTDGSSEILYEYSKRDSRIVLLKNEVNQRGFPIPFDKFQGQYFARIDSDDWWESNFLERLHEFLTSYRVDIAITGTTCYYEETKSSDILRKLENPVVLSRNQFAASYPKLWTFPSTTWGAITRLDLWRKTDYRSVLDHRYAYGGDTMVMLKYLEHCNRIGIDNSALYHYRIRRSSLSYEYNPRRFEANLAYCDQIRAFLVRHNTFDSHKKEWLKRVYLSSVSESTRLALGARNSLHEKLAVCAEIAAHPRTAEALQSASDERTNFLNMLRQLVPVAMRQGMEEDFDLLLPTLQCVCPRCGTHASRELLKLCQRDETLLPLLLNDDPTALALAISNLISQGRYTKQFNLPEILSGLLPDNPISTIRDTKFYKNYPSLCAGVIKGNTLEALDGMTEVLMNHRISYAKEEYLQLYLILSALEQQVPAFLFGKVQLAQLYLKQKNYTACEDVLRELDQMGMEDQEDVAQIKAALKEMGPET